MLKGHGNHIRRRTDNVNYRVALLKNIDFIIPIIMHQVFKWLIKVQLLCVMC